MLTQDTDLTNKLYESGLTLDVEYLRKVLNEEGKVFSNIFAKNLKSVLKARDEV
jgi:hypothetical protein